MRQSVLSILIFTAVITAIARDFSYTYNGQTLTYTVIDEAAKTCKTKNGYSNGLRYLPGNIVSGELSIPPKVFDGPNEYDVIEIGDFSFYECTNLSSINLPSSIINIGNSAFFYCKNISHIIIPENVVSIGNAAFSECEGLLSVDIPNSIKSIGSKAFYQCTYLKSAVIGNGVLTIGDSAFQKCSRLKDLTMGNLTKAIGSFAFSECYDLTSIFIPNSTISIGDYTFESCVNLTSVRLGDSLTSIGNLAFVDCHKLTSIILPNSVTTLGRNVFLNCYGLKKSAYPNTINNPFDNGFALPYPAQDAEIDNGFIYGHDHSKIYFAPWDLKGTFSIPNSVAQIGNYAFYNCMELTSVDIPNSVNDIGDYAFSGCSMLTSVEIPNSVSKIGNAAFDHCSSITTINIPNSVTDIGYNAFSECSSLKTISLSNSITHLSTGLFYKCSKLTDITLPNSITNIEQAAFSECTSLYSIDLPSSLIEIGENSFKNCKSLISIVIPSKTKTIGYNAFYGCSGLKKSAYPNSINQPIHFGTVISYPAADAEIENGIIYGANKSAIYFVPLHLNGTFITPISTKTIGEYAFKDCQNINSVIITPSVNDIGEYAFDGCSNLKKNAYPNTLNCPFKNGTSIKYLASDAEFENGVIYDANKSAIFFASLDLSEDFTTPNTVTHIGDQAFYLCKNLTSLIITDAIEHIGSEAFNGCTLNLLKIYGTPSLSTGYKGTFYELSSNTTIVCSAKIINDVKSLFDGKKIYTYDLPFTNVKIISKFCGAKLSFDENNFYELEKVENAICTVDPNEKGINISLNDGGLINGLVPEEKYKLYIKTDAESDVWLYDIEFNTSSPPTPYASSISSTQTTISFSNIQASSDESVSPIIYTIDNQGNWTVYSGKKITINNLMPMSDIFIAYADYNGYHKYLSYKTKDIQLFSESQIGPTTITLNGGYDAGDAKVTHSKWEWDGNDKDIDGNVITLTNLKPSTKYLLHYTVNVGSYSKSVEVNVNTLALELNTLMPKCVSERCAIVAAATNISEIETFVGFQWKKNDAPQTLIPNQAYAFISDGILEGYIKDLQTTSYYNVRAFYKDLEDNYYYSDWITFDPSDFCYFEPTVRTYPITEDVDNSVWLRGYVLPGTNDIITQGFQYWIITDNLSRSNDNDIHQIEVSGQMMEVHISDLKPGKTYSYRAFAQTESGYIYGTEYSFITNGESDMDNIKLDSGLTVEGYYDLMGRRHIVPQKGINIIRYTNGTYCKKYISQ